MRSREYEIEYKEPGIIYKNNNYFVHAYINRVSDQLKVPSRCPQVFFAVGEYKRK